MRFAAAASLLDACAIERVLFSPDFLASCERMSLAGMHLGSPTTLWGLRVRQDGERGQGGVTLGRSAGGRVVGAMERVLHGPPPLLMPLDHVCPLPKVCSRGLS